MQNSNLSLKIFPSIKEDWLSFIQKVSKNLQDMMLTFNNDKRRLKDLERIINKMQEIKGLSKDNIEEILNYKELFMYIDNSLESSFAALNFFKTQNNFDNEAVKVIYERIINSPKIIKINSEYNGLSMKISFDKERIKKLGELIRGSKIDYSLIKELIDKYQLNDDMKKNVLFYPLVMLSIRQNEAKNNKEIIAKKKEEKDKFYRDRFNELCKYYQTRKEELKDLLVKCFNVREKLSHNEIDMYNSYINNPTEIAEFGFDDNIKFKIYILSFFKIKKDLESFIDGISDLQIDDVNLDDELVFFQEMINEFNEIANKLVQLTKDNEEELDEFENNVFFALDAFNRLIINEELLSEKNRSSLKALFHKIENTSNSKIDGVKTNRMLGVSEEEKVLGKNISMLTTSKIKLAYIMVGKKVLVIDGVDNNNDKFDRIVRLAISKNIVPIKKQIAWISENNLDYCNLQKTIISEIMGEDLEESNKKM